MMLQQYFARWLFALLMLAMWMPGVVQVQAADLGGDCCADLEERFAAWVFPDLPDVRQVNRPLVFASTRFWARTPELAALSRAVYALTDDGEFEKAMRRLVPKAQHVHVNTALQSANSFGNSLLSCGVRGGDYVFSQEGQCNWARLTANRLDRDVTGQAPGIDKTGFGASFGSQMKLLDNFRLGFAASYEKSDARQFDALQALDHISGEVVTLGGVMKNRWGPVSASLALLGSYGWYDSERFVDLDGVGASAYSDQNVGSVSSRGRISMLFGSNGFYVKPMVDLSATWLRLGSYDEAGAGGANLHQDSASTWIVSATPALEIGGEITGVDGLLWRPFMRVGLLVHDKSRLRIDAHFIADPAGDLRSLDANFEKVYGELEAGLNVLTADGLNLKFSYEGRYGEETRSHAGHLKLSVNF